MWSSSIPYLTKEIPMRVMNQHYARRFEFGNTPARATIEVSSLPGGRPHRIYGRGGARYQAQEGRPSEEHAAQSHRESVRFCRRHIVLFRQKTALFPDPMAAYTPRLRRTNFARRCATCSIIWRRPK